MIVVVLMMRFNLGNRHEKWFFPVILIKELKSQICDAVWTIALKIDLVIVLIKHISIISVGGEFQHIGRPPESGISAAEFLRHSGDRVIDGRRFFKLTVACYMPFSDVICLVTGFLDIIRESFYVLRKHDIVAETACFCRILSGLE